MRLVLDFGNTLKKIAFYDGDTLKDITCCEKLTLVRLKSIITSHPAIDAAIISSVIRYSLSVKNYLEKNFRFIEMNEFTPVPLKVMYKTTETLGKDRLAAAVACSRRFPDKDVLVINAGTCITYDFIHSGLEYRGGAISPGMKMRFSALHNFTDKLPLVSRYIKTEITGNDTESSIISGVMNGIIAEMDGFIDKYKLKNPELLTVLSGGDAKYFDKSLKNSIFAVPNIVVEGLHIILNHNVDKENQICPV